MITRIKQLWHSIFYDGYEPHRTDATQEAILEFDSPKYPPITKGISLVDIEDLIKTQQPLIDRIQQIGGIKKDDWNRLVVPLIHNLARYVHLLPASSNGEYKGPGGLFRMSLEIGAYSLQAANGTIFANKGAATAETRFKMHPRWVYATLAAGICSMLYRIPIQMVVTDNNGAKWPVHLQSLYDWALEQGTDRIFVVWNELSYHEDPGIHQTASAYVMNIVIPKEGLQFINDENNEILPAMTAAVTGSTPIGTKNQIEFIIKSVTKQLIQRDMKSNSEHYGNFTAGAHMEPVLLDGMRKLIKKGTWSINTKGSRIWFTNEGLFIVWGLATKELIALLNHDKLSWVPTDPDTLADILISADIAESTTEDNRYWEICVPPGMQVLQALKIARIEVLFNNPQDLVRLEGSVLPKNLQMPSSANQNKTQQIEEIKGKPVSENQTQTQDLPKKTKPLLEIVKNDKTTDKCDSQPSTQEGIENDQADAENTTEAAQKESTKPEKKKAGKRKNSGSEEAKDSAPADAAPLTPMEIKVDASKATELTEQSTNLVKSLPANLSSFLYAIIEDHRDNCSDGPVFSVNDGMFISTAELEAHGTNNFTDLMMALEVKNWLWKDPEKPLRKLFEAEHEGNSLRGIIIKKDIAKLLGFNWKQPKKSKK